LDIFDSVPVLVFVCHAVISDYSIDSPLFFAMQAALRISEIARAIVNSGLWADRELLALALTCTSFTDHALDLLWIDADLYFLALIMPMKVRDKSMDDYGNYVVRIHPISYPAISA
jgi:hypothetical protein